MDKLKFIWDNLTTLNILIWAIVFWLPIAVIMLAFLPRKRSRFAMKQIRKLVREFKNNYRPSNLN